MLRIPHNFRKRAIGMFNSGMTMNVVAIKILDFLLVLFDTLGSIFKQQGVRKIDHVVDVRAS